MKARWAVVAGAALALAPLWAQAPLEVGFLKDHKAESPHPYPVGRPDRPAVWRERVVSPGAKFLRLHFVGFHLASGDYVTVSDADGAHFWTYTDRGPRGNGEFWSFAVDGDTAIVEIHAGPRAEHGYRIDAVGHGTVDLSDRGRPGPTPEVVCGTDGREDVICHLPEVDAAQKPVARLLFTSKNQQYLCTGWLVAGSNASTMITNNHCFSTQKEVDTVQAMFNYQRTTCGYSTASTTMPTTSHAGGTLLKTNSMDRRRNTGGLDYTLFTLLGNPEATWGELIATTRSVATGNPIWFIQHPGGRYKQIGYWEDVDRTMRCDVDAVNQTYGRSVPGSQIGYACDSEGGSSGSPIIEPSTGRAIGLHHFGGVNSNPCLNGGTSMQDICADAGSLLSCAVN